MKTNITMKMPMTFARPFASCALFTLALMAQALPASAQYTAKDWPDGPMKQRFTDTCGACHDINRVRVGYTPEGWRTVVRMMQNMDAPVPAEEWPAMADYLMKSFPERQRPGAVIISGPVKARIDLWDVPTKGSRPHDPRAAKDGSIWWTGQLSNKLGRIDPKTGAIREYTLKSPYSGPHGLAEDKDGNIWFTGNNLGLIGKLDPKTGITTEYPLPDKAAKDPHTINIAPDGIVWFTVQAGQHGRTARPQERRDQARHLADREVAALRADDQFERRALFRRIRRAEDRQHRSADHGDRGIQTAERRRAAAPARVLR